MKKLLVILLFITNLGFGQQVTAPDPKSFIINTSGQDASGFTLSGFNSTATLLCAIGLPQAPSGTTFYMTRFDGLTPASGFNFSGNKTRLVFTGTMTNINIALSTLRINTSAAAGNIQISVSATVNPSGYFYNPNNGHFYRPISTGANFANAITLSSQQTFKGQQGYLVTITSADEDLFIYNNVPQSNIWFAADDRATEGRWIISDGPEKNTLLRIGNASGTNQQGVYNNWANGEPNDWGGNEDAAVTKWGGGFQWNDLSTANVNPYVVEFGTWTNPDDQTFTDFYSNSVIHSNGNILRTQFQFDFGSNIDKTKFKGRIETSLDSVSFSSNNSHINLNGVGRIDVTNQMDTAQINIPGKYKALTTPGQVEWAIIDVYSSSFGGHRLYIDSREFDGTGVSPMDVNSIQLFDIYNGPMTYVQDAGSWKIFRISQNISTKITSSIYQQYLRLQNGWYGTKAEFSFTDSKRSKYHRISMDMSTQNDLQSLLSNVITVGDVYLAFREYSDRGIIGNESKYFTSGIQFHNADINEDGVFDERDCYLLLTHLQGTTSLWSGTPTLNDVMKMVPSSTYDNITKQTWNLFGDIKRSNYPFTFINGELNSYNLDITWKGDVNLSHSSQPNGFTTTSNSINNLLQVKSTSTNSINDAEAEIMMEKNGDSVIVTITLNPNGNQIGATQFDVYFNNTILEYVSIKFLNESVTNFNRDNGSVISFGSLSTSGGTINNISYKLTFKPKTNISNILGLISVKSVETLDVSLNKIKIKVI